MKKIYSPAVLQWSYYYSSPCLVLVCLSGLSLKTKMTNNYYTLSISAVRALYGLADMLRRVARMLEHEAETLEDMVDMNVNRENEWEREERISSQGERIITLY